MSRTKAILIAAYIALLIIPAITVIQNMGGLGNFSNYTKESSSLVYLGMQIFGLYSLVLLFTQVLVGAFMIPLRRTFGGWFLKWHITQGIFIYLLVLAHPALYFLFILQTSENFEKALTAFQPQFTESDIPLNIGRFGLTLLTIGVFAGLLRTRPFLMRYWRAFHYVNYAAFAVLLVHSYMIGQDTKSMPFALLYPLFVVGLLAAFFYRRIIKGSQ